MNKLVFSLIIVCLLFSTVINAAKEDDEIKTLPG
jgi:hypothetical protein